MNEMWLAAALGAGSGLALLALFARGGTKLLVESGYIALVAMLAVYVGAKLVTGSLAEIVIEAAIFTAVAGTARLAIDRWQPAIGLFILGHGAYDAIVGPHTGVATWYPPLCAGFDFIVGAGLLVILLKNQPIRD